MDNFNWGVRRPSLSHLDGVPGAAGGVGGAGAVLPGSGDVLVRDPILGDISHILPKRDSRGNIIGLEESSDDEGGSVKRYRLLFPAPMLRYYLLQQASAQSTDDNSGASSSVSTTSSGIFPPTSLPLDSSTGKQRRPSPKSEEES